jgi:type IV fimbrial biogenesis protein FimT
MLNLKNVRAAEGFTIIELMITIVIVSVTMALGMPAYTTWILNTKLRNTAESIETGLQLARAEAVRRNVPVQFVLGTGASWTFGCVTPDADCAAEIQKKEVGDGSSSAVTVTAADGKTYVFNNFGRMTSPVPASGASSINVDIDPAKLAASQSRDLRISVGISGNVRLCDPNVTTVGDSRKC